jgi:hypothetical protein
MTAAGGQLRSRSKESVYGLNDGPEREESVAPCTAVELLRLQREHRVTRRPPKKVSPHAQQVRL